MRDTMKNRLGIACAAALVGLGAPAFAQYTPPSSATPTKGAQSAPAPHTWVQRPPEQVDVQRAPRPHS